MSSIHLGVDTGGTYTDAVLFDPAARTVIAKAKALTTHGRLEQGVAQAVDRTLAVAGAEPRAIGLVSLSTTLATNALVEGQGAPAALVMIGFQERDLDRAELRSALAGDPAILLAGGHNSYGAAAAPLDLDQLEAEATKAAEDATAFAVAAQFATRNPEHELAARERLRAATGLPVTCSHELTAKLGGPRRALTAFLNARLVGLLADLIEGAEALLAERGVTAPLMVVRGDGALMSAATARERPIETILSGPAASLVGASALTGLPDAVVSDIGGTTTDVARLEGGRPRRDAEGAVVGGWRTLVEAAAIRTFGLGGDSIVGLDAQDALTLGPRRATPISLFATQHPDLVAATFERQERALRVDENAGRFVHRVGAATARKGDAGAERALLDRLEQGPAALDQLGGDAGARRALTRLAGRGAVRFAAFTPSDAAHVLGRHRSWNAEAARQAAALFARRKNRFGAAIAEGGEAFAHAVIDRLTRSSAERLIEAVAEDAGLPSTGLAASAAVARALDRQAGGESAADPAAVLQPSIRLAAPVIGLGASAPVYYPAVAEALLTEAAIPDHADVANAVGAVAGLVEARLELTILQPTDGVYAVSLGGEMARFTDAETATEAARDWLEKEARAAALASGAAEPTVRIDVTDRAATVEGGDDADRAAPVRRRLRSARRDRGIAAPRPHEAMSLRNGGRVCDPIEPSGEMTMCCVF